VDVDCAGAGVTDAVTSIDLIQEQALPTFSVFAHFSRLIIMVMMHGYFLVLDPVLDPLKEADLECAIPIEA